jgi:hypothetical protein
MLGQPAAQSPLRAARTWIDDCYATADAEMILVRLRDSGLPEASAPRDRIEPPRLWPCASPWAQRAGLEALGRLHRAMA